MERPRCHGCDCEFNAVSQPAVILAWRHFPEYVYRFCRTCADNVLLYSGPRIETTDDNHMDEEEEDTE